MPSEGRQSFLQRALQQFMVRDKWPKFTQDQVEFLRKEYPPRCLNVNESVEDHLRYAGKVELVALLGATLPEAPFEMDLTEEEAAALQDDEAISIAEGSLNKKE